MTMQVFMHGFFGKSSDTDLEPIVKTFLKRTFYTGLGIWFLLEVVLGYWWCFVTNHNPLTEHTPFVVILLFFNITQYRSLRTLGVLGAVNPEA
jgi:hypothetical protein